MLGSKTFLSGQIVRHGLQLPTAGRSVKLIRSLVVAQVAADRINGTGPSPWPDLPLEDIYGTEKALRLRQHINPLKMQHQIPISAPNWSAVYKDPYLPLVLDIGCAGGRYLLALANRLKGTNFLGVDIREPLIQRANQWAIKLDKAHAVHFIYGNATVSLHTMLASYPGPISLVSIQFPDPHFKKSHKKRRIVQPQMIKDLAGLMSISKGYVFLQSDVEDVAAAMRDEFEMYGSEHFCLSGEHFGQTSELPAFLNKDLSRQYDIERLEQAYHQGNRSLLNTSEQQAGQTKNANLPTLELSRTNEPDTGVLTAPIAAIDNLRTGDTSASQPEDNMKMPDMNNDSTSDQAQGTKESSIPTDDHIDNGLQWFKAGYLAENPIGVPTEREVQSRRNDLPVYRVLLKRK